MAKLGPFHGGLHPRLPGKRRPRRDGSGAECQWRLLEFKGEHSRPHRTSPHWTSTAGQAAPAARADTGAGGGDLRAARPAGGHRRRGLGQERDDGGAAGLAGRQRDGPPGPGARPHLHQEGRGRVRRPGALPPGAAAPRGSLAHGTARRESAGHRRDRGPVRRGSGDRHLSRLRGPAGQRQRPARGPRAVHAADHPRAVLAARGADRGRLRRPDGRGHLDAADGHRGRARAGRRPVRAPARHRRRHRRRSLAHRGA